MAEGLTARDLFAQEIYTSISGFKDSVSRYRNAITLIETKGIDSLNEQDTKIVEAAIANMRYFELHAYINLKSLKESSQLDLTTIDELRQAIDQKVPDRKKMNDLAIEYSKLLGDKFAQSLLVTNADQIGQLTGSSDGPRT